MNGQIKFDFFRILLQNQLKFLMNRIKRYLTHFNNVQVSVRKKVYFKIERILCVRYNSEFSL